jgi:hypothetical protein
MAKTKMARTRVNRKGREEWIFLNPTMGIYQSKKMKKKRMRQVTTSRPIKILFLGRFSNITSNNKFGVIQFRVRRQNSKNKAMGTESRVQKQKTQE